MAQLLLATIEHLLGMTW